MCPSRFHLPILLRSTVVTRFIATMRTLTPDPLLPAPDQVSLVHDRALPDIPPPPTPCASAPAMLRAHAIGVLSQSPRLARQRLPWVDILNREQPQWGCVPSPRSTSCGPNQMTNNDRHERESSRNTVGVAVVLAR